MISLQFHESWTKLMEWLEESESALDSELEIANDPDKIKTQLAQHKVAGAHHTLFLQKPIITHLNPAKLLHLVCLIPLCLHIGNKIANYFPAWHESWHKPAVLSHFGCCGIFRHGITSSHC